MTGNNVVKDNEYGILTDSAVSLAFVLPMVALVCVSIGVAQGLVQNIIPLDPNFVWFFYFGASVIYMLSVFAEALYIVLVDLNRRQMVMGVVYICINTAAAAMWFILSLYYFLLFWH